jgi:protocatechuate 3,4-dioxygenase beta subunit
MRCLNCLITSIILLLLLPHSLQAQETAKEEKATGSIKGAVTVDGKPAQGIKVVALQTKGYDQKLLAATLTNENGHYQLRGIPSGRCIITVDTVSLAGRIKPVAGDEKDDDDDAENEASQKSVSLEDGEELEGIDLKLIQGGVITGRVTDANGQPVIGETVKIELFDEKHRYYSTSLFLFSLLRKTPEPQTDDRGIYRAFGLPPGRYQVSVGEPSAAGARAKWGQVSLPVTYYTGTSNETKAAVVEVLSGSESANIDIRVGRFRKAETYVVSGRVVDKLTGQPIPSIEVYCDQEEGIAGDWFGTSDAKGIFRIEGLTQGKYTLNVMTDAESNWYSDEVAFEVTDADAGGIEIKAMRVGSISGIVVIENSNHPAALARLSQLQISESRLPSMALMDGARVKANGSFQMKGLKPQKQRVYLELAASEGSPFRLLRVERNGVAQTDGIALRAGENITDVRVVVSYFTGKIRGQIHMEGGSLSRSSLLYVSAILVSDKIEMESTNQQDLKNQLTTLKKTRIVIADKQGRFVMEGLPPGDYEIHASTLLQTIKPIKQSSDAGANNPLPATATRIVTVPNNAEVAVTLTLDLSKKAEDK